MSTFGSICSDGKIIVYYLVTLAIKNSESLSENIAGWRP